MGTRSHRQKQKIGRGAWKLQFLAIFWLGALHPLFSQPSEYLIRSVEYIITGITSPEALQIKIGALEGRRFANTEELEEAIEEHRRRLSNLRQLQSFEIEYRTAIEEGANAVYVTITTEDSGNFIVLPYLRYNTGDGLRLSARLRDYNFFGTLEPFAVDVDVEIKDILEDGLVRLKPQLRIPFTFLDVEWYWGLLMEFSVFFDGDFEGAIDTALGIKIPINGQLWDLIYTQGFDISITENPLLVSGRLDFISSIATGAEFDLLGVLYYTPHFYTQVGYWARSDTQEQSVQNGQTDLTDLINQTAHGPVEFGFGHSLSSGRIDWKGNLREGLHFSIGQNIIFDPIDADIESRLNALFRGHLVVDLLGFSTRVGAEYFIPISSSNQHIQNKLGSRVRGIVDRSLTGNLLVYINNDFTISGFKNKNFLEGQANFFADLAFAPDVTQAVNIERDLRLGVGVEALGFFLQARSLIVRISIGFDPLISIRTRSLLGSGNYEITIGFGHHY